VGRKRLYVELEPLSKPEVDLVQPDGSVTLLPPENPEEVFAKKVAFMRFREEEQKKKSEESAESDKKPEQGTFLWKEAVDGIRASAHHTLQLSAFLDLLSKKILTLASSGQPHFFNPIATTEAKLAKFERAHTYLSTTMSRLQEELKIDSKFVTSLGHISEKWNVKPLGRSSSVSRLPGPIGALGISLSLASSGSNFNEEFECVILRSSQGLIKASMNEQFQCSRIFFVMDPSYIPGNDTRKFKPPEGYLPVPNKSTNLDQYLFMALSSIVAKELFRALSIEALGQLPNSAAVNVNGDCVACGPILALLQSAPINAEQERKDKDGQKDTKQDVEVVEVNGHLDQNTEEPASEPPESVDKEVNGEITTEKVESSEMETDLVDITEESSTPQEFAGAGSTLLEIVARQFLRHSHKQRLKPKPSQGGHVPRKPQVPPQLPSLGILPALDVIARHHRFRSSLLEAIDTCANLPILGKILLAKLHCHRSERANVSRMCLELFNPLLSPPDNENTIAVTAKPNNVQIDVILRNSEASVSVSPAIVAPGRLVERNMFTSTAPLKYFIENNMAILFFQILQKEAEAWSCATVFPPIILEEESTADLMFRLIVWPPAAERGDEDERYKMIEYSIQRDVERLTVSSFADEASPAQWVMGWHEFKGRDWRDKFRRIALLW